ncbi:MAG: NAD(P)-dependent oxidoreductase [Bacteroidales bacterium]|nr:NAD(P)-dependent oxidoreductase [Bacteroidales bacterium]
MKKVLITGASGFIGGFLVEETLKRNYDVFAGVRSSSNRDYLKHPSIYFFESNLGDKNALKNKLTSVLNEHGKFDYIIHNAGITKSCNKHDFEKVNYQFTRNLIEALTEANALPEKFVFMSSLAAYGPGNEKTLEAILQSDVPQPVTLYGKSKLKAEQYIQSLDHLPYLIIRPTGVYGPREKDYYVVYKTINKGLETYIGRTDQHISFIYVRDLTRLIFNALDSSVTQKAYFVSDGDAHTSSSFMSLLKHELKKKTVRIVFPMLLVRIIAFINEKLSCIFGISPTLNTEKYKEISSKNWLCDTSEIVKDFGFVPEYNLQKGIKETITWYKNEKLL